jgi:hypothetical protein
MPHSSAEQIVRRMEQSLTDLQRQLNLDLAQLQASMKAERHDLERHVARVRQMASEHRLALTLFELFDALKALPKKTTEAQQIDRAWHGQVGIEPDDILLPEDESDPWKIYFKLSGVWYLLIGNTVESIIMRSLFMMKKAGCLPNSGHARMSRVRSSTRSMCQACMWGPGWRSSSR